MKLNKSKSGISLIVLVITIIVMIILAAAIILALNSSNITGKANEAKTSSDAANKKEAASVHLSEYYLKVAQGKVNSDTTTADAYVKAELKKAGLATDDIVVTEEGDILVGIAAMFVNNDVELGTTVEGYKLNNTTTYATSGKENTYTSENGLSATLTRNEDITWKYFGTDENGEVLIVGSVTNNTPKMTLGGKGGYLYGPEELNNVCDAMYSSSMGKARSIDIDDVTRVLEFTGGRGGCVDPETNMYTFTTKAKTINELAEEIGYDMSIFANQTPEDGKAIGMYKADCLVINKKSDKDHYNSDNTIAMGLIYAEGTNASNSKTYWLSTNCVYTYFNSKVAKFSVSRVSFVEVGRVECFGSNGKSTQGDHFVRPVVSLNSSVQMTYENGVVTLK